MLFKEEKLQEILDLMTKKELRIQIPLEEIDILWRLKADNCLMFRRMDGRAAGETVTFSEILDNYRLLTDLKHVPSTLNVWGIFLYLNHVFFSSWWLTLMTPGHSIQSSNIL